MNQIVLWYPADALAHREQSHLLTPLVVLLGIQLFGVGFGVFLFVCTLWKFSFLSTHNVRPVKPDGTMEFVIQF